MKKRHYTYVYLVVIFPNRIKLLTCMRKLYELHATFPWFSQKFIYTLFPFSDPNHLRHLLFAPEYCMKHCVCSFQPCLYSLHTHRSTVHCSDNYMLHISYIQLFLLANIHYWVGYGFSYINSVTLYEV